MDAEGVPYLALALPGSPLNNGITASAPHSERTSHLGELVGYGSYLDRVPPNPASPGTPRTTRWKPSAPRSRWNWAKRGARVAVVSSGDPGVFAMAAAVLEVAEDPQWSDVPVRVLPGLTAA